MDKVMIRYVGDCAGFGRVDIQVVLGPSDDSEVVMGALGKVVAAVRGQVGAAFAEVSAESSQAKLPLFGDSEPDGEVTTSFKLLK
jgi:hypothetical protein